MKPASFLIGLSMLLSLGACAAPYGEDAERGTREEAVKSAEQDVAFDALRSRVQEDFASAPSMRGHEIVLVVDRIAATPDAIAVQAHIAKLAADGTQVDLEDLDFAGAVDGETRVTSPYRANVTAIVVKDEAGEWSTLKSGILGSRAVEKYVSGQTPEVFDGFAQEVMTKPSRSVRTKP